MRHKAGLHLVENRASKPVNSPSTRLVSLFNSTDRLVFGWPSKTAPPFQKQGGNRRIAQSNKLRRSRLCDLWTTDGGSWQTAHILDSTALLLWVVQTPQVPLHQRLNVQLFSQFLPMWMRNDDPLKLLRGFTPWYGCWEVGKLQASTWHSTSVMFCLENINWTILSSFWFRVCNCDKPYIKIFDH